MTDTVDRDSVFANYKSVVSKQFGISLVVEFVGTMMFQVIGGAAQKEYGPFVNGFALAVWIYTAANISGGHLNPAVTLSTFFCGFYPLAHTLLYVALQIIGAIFGALILAGLVPGASIAMGDGGPGCFDRTTTVGGGVTNGQIFAWELVMTFTLISCVYACGVAKPGHGSHTPYAVGLALLCCAGSGGQYTGAALNPARVLGPRAVFQCGLGLHGLYIWAQLTAAALACSIFAFVSGPGPLNPHMVRKAVPGMRRHEAFFVWFTGSPPRRFRDLGCETMADLVRHAAEQDAATEALESQGHSSSSKPQESSDLTGWGKWRALF
jgi:glycerol uptake facilitator-like aquaporin